MLLQFRDPSKLKTKKIVFENIFPALDSGTLEQLKELSSKRRVIEESINESSCITEAIAREISGGLTSQCEQAIQRLEQYIPLLENFVYHLDLISVDSRVVRWTSNTKIRWSSSLTSPSLFNLNGSKFFQIDNLRFELGMVLFLYGAMLREWAYEVLSADMVKSATIFRKAAGVYEYLAHEILPSLQPALAPDGPPEATSSVSSIMSLLCLAEAQVVTIRKAEEKGNTGSLLAKLHYGVVQLLDEATFTAHSAAKVCKDMSMRLLDFISSCRALHESRSYKYLAEAYKTDDQIGLVIGLLQKASSNMGKSMPGEDSWGLVIKQEVDSLNGLLKKYEHENDFVWHEKIPFDEYLPTLEGKKLVSSIPYHPRRWERTLAFKL